MKKYLYLFPLLFNIFFPIIGVFFFNWSIGDIFFLFFFELLFLGGETIIKIIFAFGKADFFSKIGSILRFILIYPVFFLFILILTGNFFDGGGKQMFLTITRETIYLLLANFIANLLAGYFFSGKFLTALPKDAEKETYYHLITTFLSLFVLLLPLSKIMSFTEVNYAMAVGIILTKNGLDYLLYYRKSQH